MKNLILLFIAICHLASCQKEPGEDPVGYFLKFDHNGTVYNYDYLEAIDKRQETESGNYFLNASNFFDSIGVAATVVFGLELEEDESINSILSRHTGKVDVTIEPEPEPGIFFFSVFFHRSSNGGFLERDGEQSVELNFVSAKNVQGNCFDVNFSFSLFANSGTPLCEEYCFNDFAGNGKVKLCYN